MNPQPPVLAGTRILVTAQRRSADLASALQRRGAQVEVAAALGVESHIDEPALIARSRALIKDPADIVVVTTGVGFSSWLETAEAAGLLPGLEASLRQARIVARGPKARGAIQAAGLSPDWVAESETSAEMGEFLVAEGVADQRIFIQQHGAGDDGLTGTLTDAGASVTTLVIYRWGPPPDPEGLRRSILETAAGQFDCVTFTSAPAAAAWIEEARANDVLDDIQALVAADRLLIATVGPITAAPLVTAKLSPLVPDRGRLGALIRAVVLFYSDEEHATEVVDGQLRVRASAATLDHVVLPISPSGLEVLRLLAVRPGAVVAREDLLEVLPGDSADPHAAEVAVARLRESLGNLRVVKTVVKRGYRLDVVQESP